MKPGPTVSNFDSYKRSTLKGAIYIFE